MQLKLSDVHTVLTQNPTDVLRKKNLVNVLKIIIAKSLNRTKIARLGIAL